MPKKASKAKAKAQAVANLSSAAERGWDVQAVFKEKGSIGLKLSDKLVPGKVAVKEITEGSQAASMHPELRPGLVVTYIGDKDVSGMDYDDVIAAIKAHPQRPLAVGLREPAPTPMEDDIDMLDELDGLDIGRSSPDPEPESEVPAAAAAAQQQLSKKEAKKAQKALDLLAKKEAKSAKKSSKKKGGKGAQEDVNRLLASAGVAAVDLPAAAPGKAAPPGAVFEQEASPAPRAGFKAVVADRREVERYKSGWLKTRRFATGTEDPDGPATAKKGGFGVLKGSKKLVAGAASAAHRLDVTDTKKDRWFVYEKRRLDWWASARDASGAKTKEKKRLGRLEMVDIRSIAADAAQVAAHSPLRQPCARIACHLN
eukprot:COSAG05_NODE_329_length_11294_cov_59.570076_7_plen_370_part_00